MILSSPNRLDENVEPYKNEGFNTLYNFVTLVRTWQSVSQSAPSANHGQFDLLGPITDIAEKKSGFRSPQALCPLLPRNLIGLKTHPFFPLALSTLILSSSVLLELLPMAGESTITSNLHWISQMDVDVEPTAGRKSSIICTIGKCWALPQTQIMQKSPEQRVLTFTVYFQRSQNQQC
jgi:hypothetical protein